MELTCTIQCFPISLQIFSSFNQSQDKLYKEKIQKEERGRLQVNMMGGKCGGRITFVRYLNE